MSKSQIISQEKADRFTRMFGPRIKQLDKQIQLVQNCSRKDGYEWGFTNHVPTAFIVLFKKLNECSKKFGLEVEVKVNGRDIEEVFEDAQDKFNEL